MARACDWVVELGADDPFMWVMFGCNTCETWTLGSHCWYRCQRVVRDLKVESASAGADEGHWRCATCWGKWCWGLCGPMRLVVIGRASMEGGFEPGYQFAYIGDTDASIDNKMAFLRTASILRVLSGKEVTKESLMAALDTLSNNVVCKFSKGVREVRCAQAMEVSSETQDQAGVRIVCEDPRLSLHAAGQEYLVLDKKLIEAKKKEPICTIDQDFLHYLLDYAAASYDIEATWPSGDATRKLRNRILDSAGFLRARRVIAAAL